MGEIAEMTEHIVGQAKNYESDTIPGDFATLGVPLPEMRRRGARELQEIPVPDVRLLACGRSSPAASSSSPKSRALLHDKREVGPLDGFRSKMGRPFAAMLKLNDALEAAVRFRPGSATATTPKRPISAARNRSAPARSAATRVFEPARGLRLRKSGRARSKTCDFRSGEIILQRPIEREQMQKLLATGKTDLLAVRLVAHAAPVLGVPGAAARRQDRLRVPGQGRRQGRGARGRGAARRCGCSARIPRTSGRSSCMRGATVRT